MEIQSAVCSVCQRLVLDGAIKDGYDEWIMVIHPSAVVMIDVQAPSWQFEMTCLTKLCNGSGLKPEHVIPV